ncbi:HD domain-containing protein [Vibrio chagasii]|nr:HD domain-containing protein [Vibrio chagasii]
MHGSLSNAGLWMRSVSSENISEHSLWSLSSPMPWRLSKQKFDGKLNPEHIAPIGMYHDTSEVLTGDLPTPVKYYNPDIAQEYKKIEAVAEQRLLSMLP